MPRANEDGLTEPQRQWFASVRAGLERETGRTLEAWVELARACPETRHRARLTWMKTNWGLGQNRASIVLAEAFPQDGDDAGDRLWTKASARAIFAEIEAVASTIEGVVVTQRKDFTAFSRRHQFAAARPLKGGVRLGLALAPDMDARLGSRTGSESWSDRLRASLDLGDPAEVDDAVAALIRHAAETP